MKSTSSERQQHNQIYKESMKWMGRMERVHRKGAAYFFHFCFVSTDALRKRANSMGTFCTRIVCVRIYYPFVQHRSNDDSCQKAGKQEGSWCVCAIALSVDVILSTFQSYLTRMTMQIVEYDVSRMSTLCFWHLYRYRIALTMSFKTNKIDFI